MLSSRERLTCRLHLRSKLAAIDADIAAKPEPFLSRKYLPVAEELAKSHKLKVPASTIETLATAIMKCRTLEPRPKKQKGEEPSPRERLETALTHARKLLEYTERNASHGNSISTRSESLRDALDDSNAVIWLAVASPPIDVPLLVDRLKSYTLNKDELTKLVSSLDSTLSRDSERTGRPTEMLARIIRAGCDAWLKSNPKKSFMWNDKLGCLEGSLPPFIRGLLSACDGTHERVRYIEHVWNPERLTVWEVLQLLEQADIQLRTTTTRDKMLAKLATLDSAEYTQSRAKVAKQLEEAETAVDKDVQVVKTLQEQSKFFLMGGLAIESESAIRDDFVRLIRQHRASLERYTDLQIKDPALRSALKDAFGHREGKLKAANRRPQKHRTSQP